MSNIMSVIFICAALLLTFTYSKPMWSGRTGSSDVRQQSVVELKAERVKYEEALEKTREIERVREGLQSKYNALTEEDHRRLNKLLPDGIDSVRMIVDLDSAARMHGLVMRDIVVTDPKDRTRGGDQTELANNPGFYSFVDLNFNVAGAYDDLAGFLRDIEKSLRIFDVVKLNIESATQAYDYDPALMAPKYKARISLKVYYLN